jgi:hypothetical protein
MTKPTTKMDRSRTHAMHTPTLGARSFIGKSMKPQPKSVKSETFVTRDENI